jgi:hypothetical protein
LRVLQPDREGAGRAVIAIAGTLPGLAYALA